MRGLEPLAVVVVPVLVGGWSRLSCDTSGKGSPSVLSAKVIRLPLPSLVIGIDVSDGADEVAAGKTGVEPMLAEFFRADRSGGRRGIWSEEELFGRPSDEVGRELDEHFMAATGVLSGCRGRA